MKWFRSIGILAIAFGVALLAVGWALSYDFLGFLFMMLLVGGLALLIVDFFLRRRGHTPA